MVGGVGTSTSVEVTTYVISQISVSTISPEVDFSPLEVASIPTTFRFTQLILGNPKPSFLPNISLPPTSRDYQYYMPTEMMVGLQNNVSM